MKPGFQPASRPARNAVALAVALAFLPAAGWAMPTGEQVVAGQVAVDRPAADRMLIRQGTNAAIVNWNGFSIGAGEAVRIQQPAASSVMLNRVIGNDRSDIFGSLSANGRVFLVNPTGVLFAPSATVDVGSLVASTLAIDNADFLAGRYLFSGAGASVVNGGRINAADKGTVALLGGEVRNDGTIVARLGSVILGAGGRMTLDLSGDGLSQLTISQGTLAALVANGGALIADGGQVLLSAQALGELVGTVVNQGGVVRARSLAERNGRIVLDGGEAGDTMVTGTADASGPAAGTTGGEIQVLGQHVGIASAASLDASGRAGGGRVIVGGDYQGANPTVRNAAATWFGPQASIRADAIDSGNGGTVVVWSDGPTRAYGSISARGGSGGGNGGLVETSGHWLDVAGLRVDASAPAGLAGTWLLDPYDLTISTSPTTSTDNNTDSAPVWNASDIGANVAVGQIANRLNAGTSVEITTGTAGGQSGNITWLSGANLNVTSATRVSLSVVANNDLLVESGVQIVSSAAPLDVDFSAGGGVRLAGTPSSPIRIASAGGNVSLTGAAGFGAGVWLQDATIDSGAGSISLVGVHAGSGGSGDGVRLESSSLVTASGDVSLVGSGSTSFASDPPVGGVGVRLTAGSSIVTGSGAIDIIGSGGNGGESDGFGVGGAGGAGVSLEDSSLRSTSGDIAIVATGGSGGPGSSSSGPGADAGAGGAGLTISSPSESGAEIRTTSGQVDFIVTGGDGGVGGEAGGAAGGAGGTGGAGFWNDGGTLIADGTGSFLIVASGGVGGSGGDATIGATGASGGRGGDGGHGVYNTGLIQTATGGVSVIGSGGDGGQGGSTSNTFGSGFGGTGGNGVAQPFGSIVTASGDIELRGAGGFGGGRSLSGGLASIGSEGFNGTGINLGSGFGDSPTLGSESGDITVFGLGRSLSDIRPADGVVLFAATVETSDGGNIDLRGRSEATAFGFINAGILITDSAVRTRGAPGRIMISGETLTDYAGVQITVDESATTIGGPETSGSIAIRARNDGGGDAIEFGSDVAIRTSGVVNLRPGGVDASGALTAADAMPIYVANPAFAGEFALGPFGFVLSDSELATVQADAGIVIGSDTHVGAITYDLPFTWTTNLTLQNEGAGAGGIFLDSGISLPGRRLALATMGPLVSAGSIVADELLVRGAAATNASLNDAGNSVNRLAVDPPASFAFTNAGPIVIGPVSAFGFSSSTNLVQTLTASNSTSLGDFFVRTLSGSITLGQNITTLDPGSNITLVSATNFISEGGALTPGAGGTWRIWADTWIGELRNGLDPAAFQPSFYGCAFGAASCASSVVIPSSGNRFIYAQQPTLRVVADNQIRPLGAPNPDFSYTISGLLPGDSRAGALSGALGTTAARNSPPGSYSIDNSAGGLSSPVGYALLVTPGTLRVGDADTGGEEANVLRPTTETTYLYDRNLGLPAMCVATGPLMGEAATQGSDILSIEWSRVRLKPNLSNCVDVDERNGCSDF